jgi:hypothetical protein
VTVNATDAEGLHPSKTGVHISYQFVKDTVVQLHFGPATLPQLVVVVLEALPVGLELVQAVGVNVLDTATGQCFLFN